MGHLMASSRARSLSEASKIAPECPPAVSDKHNTNSELTAFYIGHESITGAASGSNTTGLIGNRNFDLARTSILASASVRSRCIGEEAYEMPKTMKISQERPFACFAVD